MSESWTVAGRFSSVGEAAAARSALDAAGIDTYLADENIVSIDWLYSQAVGALKVMVHDDDLERARELIGTVVAEQPPPDFTSAAPIDVSADRCAQCGSSDLRPIPRVRIFLLLAMVFIGIGAAVGQTLFAATGLLAVAVGVALMPSHRCAACGERLTPLREHGKAPLPDARDMVEEPCPRCGSLEVFGITQRRLKALPLLFAPLLVFVLPIWWLQPKRRCEKCQLEMR